MSAENQKTYTLGGMLVIAAAALGVSGAFVLCPTILAALVLSHGITGFPRLPRPRTVTAVLIALPFILWWRQYSRPEMMNHIPAAMLLFLGMYLTALGVSHFLSLGRGGSAEHALACAIMGLGLAGVAEHNVVFVPLLAVFVVLLLWHLRQDLLGRDRKGRGHSLRASGATRWKGRLKHAAALGLLAALTVGMHVSVVENLPELNRWVVRQVLLGGQGVVLRPGFSRRSRLSSIKRMRRGPGNRQVVLRVWADQSPEYLRGAVYARYHRGRWELIEVQRRLEPQGMSGGRHVFQMAEQRSRREMGVIYPASDVAHTFFLPPGVHQVSSFNRHVICSDAFTARVTRGDLTGGYGYFAPVSNLPPPTDAALRVPLRLRAQLTRIVRSIMPASASAREKIRRLKRFFREKFTYRVGLQLRGSRDPILQFLTRIRAGHCEYFASAGVLLLRAAGIPARYVTGFVCRESGMGGYGIVRRNDAHAWVQAYVEGRWIVVDPTPPAGRPTPMKAGWWGRLGGALRAYAERVWRLAANGGLSALWDMLILGLQRVPWWIWAAGAGFGLFWMFRGNLRLRTGTGGEQAVSERTARLREKLARAERMLAPHGIRRSPSTPVGRLLDELNEAELPDHVRTEAGQLLIEYQQQRFREQSMKGD